MKILLLSVVGLSLAGLVSSTSLAATDCMQTAQTQTAMTQCAGQQYKQADTRLNEQYQSLTSRLAKHPKQQAQLLTAQRSWLAFRDAECRFNASPVAGGSVQPMVRLQCLARLTTDRNAQLHYYLNCQEGDMSCPAPNSEQADKQSDTAANPT